MKKYRKPLVREINVELEELLAESNTFGEVPFYRPTETDETDEVQEIGWKNPFDGRWQ